MRSGRRSKQSPPSKVLTRLRTADLPGGKITVIGTVNPVDVMGKLRKLFPTAQFVSVGPAGPAKEPENGNKKVKSATPYWFTVEFFNRITNNFSEERIIGCGRQGVVYKVL